MVDVKLNPVSQVNVMREPYDQLPAMPADMYMVPFKMFDTGAQS